jgi:phosphohistidine phosphatase
MKHVILMRHAKSDWKLAGLTDHQRPLNKRGVHDAPLMGASIKKRGIIPELVLVSDAKRTQETWSLLSPLFEGAQTKFDAELYLASSEIILAKIRGMNHLIDTVLLLAHNPGITEAFLRLANINTSGIPTSGVCCIRLHTDDFKNTLKCKKELVYFTYPAEL